MKKKTEGGKRPFFTVANLVTAVVCFVLFVVVSLAGHYLSMGEFVSANLAAVYAVLAGVGALTILFRFYRFALLYYIGCILGWVTGWYVGGLKGEFAPTAGTICTVFLIAVFSFFGIIAQYKGIRSRMARRREEREAEIIRAEEERKQAELDAARLERLRAEDAMNAAAAEAVTVPAEPESPMTASGEPAAAPAPAELPPVVPAKPLAEPEDEKTAPAPEGTDAADKLL